MAKKPFAESGRGPRGDFSGAWSGAFSGPRSAAHFAAGASGAALKPLIVAIPNVSGSITGGGVVTSSVATVTTPPQPADATYRYYWSQVDSSPVIIATSSGGVVTPANGGAVRFSASLSEGSSIGSTWRCVATNDYGQVVQSNPVSVSLVANEDIPDLHAEASPSGPVNTDGNGDITLTFSVSVTGGVKPYFFNWNGGPTDGTDHNSKFIHIEPGQADVDYIAGCTIHDSGGNQTTATFEWTVHRP